ncbi:hypothetical protein J7643_00980 [bacterium]|nr:hypothetical protein [bacterium]
MSKIFARLLAIPLCAVLPSACWSGPNGAGTSNYSLTGRVDLALLSKARRAQATFDEVADAATVSLMESAGTSSVTIATTLTKPGGTFKLTFTAFRPQGDRTYLLEAVKGLGGNAVNRDAVRIRTLIRWREGWVSLTNATVGGRVNLGLGSTAVAILYNLRPEGVSPADLMGSVQPDLPEALPLPASLDTFTPVGGYTKQDFHTVSDLVDRAVLGDSDPITALQFDTDKGAFIVKTAEDPFIDNLSSTVAGYGAPLIITGYRFDPDIGKNTVYFGGATGSVAVIDPKAPNSPNALYVSVPEGAPSGDVMVRNSFGLSNGIRFTVIPRLGGAIVN